jgi:hypothetical protein
MRIEFARVEKLELCTTLRLRQTELVHRKNHPQQASSEHRLHRRKKSEYRLLERRREPPQISGNFFARRAPLVCIMLADLSSPSSKSSGLGSAISISSFFLLFSR